MIFSTIKVNCISADEYEDFYRENYPTYGDYVYEIEKTSDGEEYISIIKYYGEENEIKIPSEIEGIEVKSIGEDFCENENVTIYTGKNVTHIAASAFDGCKKLEKIKLSKKLKYIGMYAFYYCGSLKTIKIPESVVYCGKNSFAGSFNGKIIKSPYLKKMKVYGTDNAYKYMARGTVTYKKKGKTINKSYWAPSIKKIKGKKKITISKGDSSIIKTSLYTRKGKRKGYLNSNILKFTSSDKSIAKVSKYGKIRGLKKGVVDICVNLRTDDNISYDIKVYVK